MLHALREYARQEQIMAEPGLKPKTVRWLLVFSPEGRFLGLQDLAGGQRGAKGREFPACPDLTQQEMVAAGAGCRHFLVDSLDVVALLTKDGRVDDKLSAKHAFFVGLLEKAAGCLPALRPIAGTLRDEGVLETIRAQLAEGKAKPTELGTIAVAGAAGPTILVEQPEWRDWWQAFRRQLADDRRTKASRGASRKKSGDGGEKTKRMRCLLSGELVDPLATHNKIEGLSDVGGLSMGDALASFDKEAFNSFGLQQGANAAMGETMVKTYVSALNHLIRYRSRRMAGVKLVYWYSGRVKPEDDPLLDLLEGFGLSAEEPAESSADPAPEPSSGVREQAQAESRARRLLEAIHRGERADLAGYRFYALTLSANSGRVVVRDWMEGPFTELAEAVNAWFEDLAVPLLDSTRIANPPRFEQLLTSCLQERPAAQSYADWAKPVAPHRFSLWNAALGGAKTPIPRALVEQVVLAHVAALLKGKVIFRRKRNAGKADEPVRDTYRLSLLLARLGLMRAYCNRFSRITEQGDYSVDSILDVNHPRAAYHVGRLMAVLEMIQRRAQGELGATIAQTHYASAATRPIAALPRLETLVQHHIPKIEPFLLRQQYQALLTEINLAIGRTIPRTFDLEDQCLFHLGYYHQRAYAPYDESPFRHWTLNGEQVRSKSEVIVANLLKSLGIEYLYEEPLYFKGNKILESEEAEARTIRPDFTIRKTKDGRIVYLEHLGMMDNFAYRSDWKRRQETYHDLGILPADQGGGPNGVLVVTEERNGTIDCRVLVETLKQLV